MIECIIITKFNLNLIIILYKIKNFAAPQKYRMLLFWFSKPISIYIKSNNNNNNNLKWNSSWDISNSWPISTWRIIFLLLIYDILIIILMDNY